MLKGKPGLLQVYERAKGQEGENSWEWQHEGRYYDGKVSAFEIAVAVPREASWFSVT